VRHYPQLPAPALHLIRQREGRYPLPPGASETLGVEFAGTVVKLGPNSGLWAVGDEVLGLATSVSAMDRTYVIYSSPSLHQGAYAEYIAIGINFVLPKPPRMSWVIAASIMENYITGTPIHWKNHVMSH
jgi:NADPH:quinone reductase-like Zn-dependent oxidoreductase